MSKISRSFAEFWLSNGLSARSRWYFSRLHLSAAKQFAEDASTIEAEFDADKPGAHLLRHRSLVSSAVVLSVAALEAGINELFSDTQHVNPQHLGGLTEEQIALLGDMWGHGIPRTARYSILDKYAIALSLLRKPPLDKSSSLYAGVQALVQLRNALVHFEPEWQDLEAHKSAGTENSTKLEKVLRGKFKPNPLAAGSPAVTFFPDLCLGSGCAHWAIERAIAFEAAFLEAAGIDPDSRSMSSLVEFH